jgi:FtsH-binding integral membrane protein
MIVNIFLQSSAMQFAISAIGVLLFAALTAYDTQNIKNTYLALAGSNDDFLGKSAIMGALTLYLDFLNLFMFLMQFMGQSRD